MVKSTTSLTKAGDVDHCSGAKITGPRYSTKKFAHCLTDCTKICVFATNTFVMVKIKDAKI